MKFLTACLLVFQILWGIIRPIPQTSAILANDVLVISSYHDGFSWSDAELQGVRDQLGNEAQIHVEYMDTKRFFSDEYKDQFFELLRFKYENWQFDAIITLDNDAFQLMLERKDELSAGTPLIFCGVNQFSPDMVRGRSDVTGIVEETSPLESILLALEIHPETDTVWIVTDNTTTGQVNRELYESEAFQSQVPVPIRFFDTNEQGLYLDELKQKMANVSSSSVIFFSDFAQDLSGQFMAPDKITPYLAETSNAPIYAMYDFYLGVGAVGGMMESGYLQGSTAGELTRQILNGSEPADLPIITENLSRYMFDYTQMRTWGISRSELPADRTVINLPFEFYRENKLLVWSVVSFIAVETLIIGLLVINIQKRRKVEQSLSLSEERYRNLFEHHSSIMLLIDFINGRILDANPTASEYYGYTTETLRNMKIHQLSTMPEEVIEDRLLHLQDNRTITFYSQHIRHDGAERHVEIHGSRIPLADQSAFFLIINDVHARYERQHEMEAALRLAVELRSINERKEIVNRTLLHIKQNLSAMGTALAWQKTPNTQPVLEISDQGNINLFDKAVQDCVIKTINEQEAKFMPHPNNGRKGQQHYIGCMPLLTEQGNFGSLVVILNREFDKDKIRLLSTFGEMAASSLARSTHYEANQAQLRKLAALHRIDQSILTSDLLKKPLDVVLSQADRLLEIDAGMIYLYNPQEQTTVLEAQFGYDNDKLLETSEILKPDSFLSFILENQKETIIFDLENESAAQAWELQIPHLKRFRSVYGTTLVAQNEVRGFFILLKKEKAEFSQDWLDYAETLAGQATIAIVNYGLIADLRQSNQNLVEAYDETIESLAKVLELRHYETLGHSKRVTELTISVAQRFGFSNEELKDIERGALLHDIGKLAIPDEILRKAEDLSDAEWVIMHQHPTYAYEMLRDIKYLENAILLAYCHHEHWDGNGYPNGLKGRQIPLPARIFAVVDVWDALLEDRPYRDKRWTREEVIEYIKEQSGKQFDPAVVEIFLEYLEDNDL